MVARLVLGLSLADHHAFLNHGGYGIGLHGVQEEFLVSLASGENLRARLAHWIGHPRTIGWRHRKTERQTHVARAPLGEGDTGDFEARVDIGKGALVFDLQAENDFTIRT